jgi:hypothetical protein
MDKGRRHPVRILCAALACCALTALSSCSGSPVEATSTTNGGNVRLSLLTAEEIPSYGTTQPTGWTVSTSASQAPPPMCPSHPLSKLNSEGYASITFDPQINSAPELIEQVVRSSSAKAEFAAMEKSIQNCKVFRVSVPGGPTSSGPAIPGTLTPFSFPSYGDQSVARLQTLYVSGEVGVPEPSFPPPGDLQTGAVLIRTGDYLLLLAYFPSSSAFTPNQLRPFVRSALAKLP